MKISSQTTLPFFLKNTSAYRKNLPTNDSKPILKAVDLKKNIQGGFRQNRNRAIRSRFRPTVGSTPLLSLTQNGTHMRKN
jgi:hypothetical protein